MVVIGCTGLVLGDLASPVVDGEKIYPTRHTKCRRTDIQFGVASWSETPPVSASRTVRAVGGGAESHARHQRLDSLAHFGDLAAQRDAQGEDTPCCPRIAHKVIKGVGNRFL